VIAGDPEVALDVVVKRTASALPPRAPFLVVIAMTPAAAREPNSVDAAAPLTISTDSMSYEFRSAMLDPRTTPSTTYRGSCPRPDALMDVGPRRTTAGAEPGRPLVAAMLAPVTRPWIWLSRLTPCTGIWSTSTRETENGTLARSCAPPLTPVTTISLISRARCSIETFAVVTCPAVTVICLVTVP